MFPYPRLFFSLSQPLPPLPLLEAPPEALGLYIGPPLCTMLLTQHVLLIHSPASPFFSSLGLWGHLTKPLSVCLFGLLLGFYPRLLLGLPRLLFGLKQHWLKLTTLRCCPSLVRPEVPLMIPLAQLLNLRVCERLVSCFRVHVTLNPKPEPKPTH